MGKLAALVLGLALDAGEAQGGDWCVSNGACAPTAPCLWSDPGTWSACDGGLPGIGDDWRIAAGDTVVYDTDGATSGSVDLEGTLLFGESAAGRDARGFRTLTIVVAAGTQGDLRIGPAGALVLRRGSRILFDTTADRSGQISISNGGLLDSRGSVWPTTVADVTASDGDDATCGTAAGRRYVITPRDGIDNVPGTYLDSRVLHRRLVFLTGKLKSRHYEIVSTDDPIGSTVTVCTDLADERSHGQRLTPHVSVGAPPAWEARHSVPEPSLGSAANDPAVGDQIAIVEDVWIGKTGGEKGWRMLISGEGLDPLPIIQATNLSDFGADGDGTGGVAAQFVPRSATQPVPDFTFNNMHDGTSQYGIVFKAYHDSQVRWNALHDYPRVAAGTNNHCVLNLHQNKIAEGGRFDGPVHDVDVSDNVGYRTKQCVIQVNDGGNDPAETIANYQARGMLVRRNLLFGGCANQQGDSPCFALDVNSCRDCDVANNVVYDICQNGGIDGYGIYLGGDAGNEGTSVRENWVVNTCGSGIVLSDGTTAPPRLDSEHRTTVVHNYISNTRRFGGQGGIWIGNIIKNFGIDNPAGTWALVNPVRALSNVIFVDETQSAKSGAGAVCDAATAKCGLVGIVFTRGDGNQTARPVTVSDLLVGAFSRAALNKYGVGIGDGSMFDPDYGGDVSHVTIDGRQNGMMYGIRFTPNGAAAAPRLWTLNDIACTNKNGADCVSCTTRANWEEIAEQIHTVVSGVPQENGGMVSNTCFDRGVVTTSATLNYQARDDYDYNFIAGAPQLTAGHAPPGSPIGIRAFRFNRARMNNPWGGALTFDGSFPADIANVPNDDTDEDGVIDLFDICPADFNPAQFDEDGDGTAACGGDCDDTNSDVHPGQVEACDGIDNDCNDLVDDLDRDGDGHSSCLDDCDDSSAAIHPGALEICNGLDDSCNSLVDEDANGVDADADGQPGACDNCASDFNPAQEDLDLDGEGDVCDLDDGLILLRWPSSSILSWQQESGDHACNLYRGDLHVLRTTGVYTQNPAVVPLARRICGVTTGWMPETDTPGPGQVMFYLVTGISPAGEGSLGTDSKGHVRRNRFPCP